MNQPQIIKATKIDGSSLTQTSNGRWVPARPLPYFFTGVRSLFNRIYCAWLVFTGRCDVLDWEQQEGKR